MIVALTSAVVVQLIAVEPHLAKGIDAYELANDAPDPANAVSSILVKQRGASP